MKDQRGSGSLLMCAVVAVLLVITWVGAVGGAYAVALHRARGVADRAALAGAQAYAHGQEPCAAARRQVAADGVTGVLSGCRFVGDAYQYVISVTVARRVAAPVPGLPGSVRAAAFAGPVEIGSGLPAGWPDG